MKKKSFLLILFLISILFFNCVTTKNSEISFEESPHNKEFLNIFNELYDFVSQNRNKSPDIFNRIDVIKNKIYSNEIILKVDHSMAESIFGGMEYGFYINKGVTETFISTSPFFLTVYENQPGIVFSILMHEIQHSYDYYYNHDLFLIGATNKLEKYLFELDAHHIEAVFIRDFLMPAGDKLTEFEEFIVYSFDNDYLDFFSITLLGIDMDLIFYMQDYAADKSFELITQEFIDIGNIIIDEFQFLENEEEFTKLLQLTPGFSFLIHSKQMYYDISLNKSIANDTPDEFTVLKYSPELDDVYNRMNSILMPYYTTYLEILSNNISAMDNSFKNSFIVVN